MHGLEETAKATGYAKLAPPAELAPFVDHVRLVPPSVHDTPYVRLPDGQVELVLRAAGSGDSDWLNVVGTRSTTLRKPGGPHGAFCVVVRFRAAGGYPFFGLPLSELTDRMVPIDLLWGGDFAALQDALYSARDPRAAVDRVLRARLRGPLLYEPPLAGRIRRGVRWLERESALPSVEQLADKLGTSARQLRRSFAEVVGLTPKHYLRIVRFQRARRLARHSAEPNWSAVAKTAGYFDQAHMIHDFRALCGCTPAALHSERAGAGVSRRPPAVR
jgi:AraC-like DNA-binding protein